MAAANSRYALLSLRYSRAPGMETRDMFSRSRRARKLPDDGPRNGWYETLPPPPSARTVEGVVKADFAVIGAGTCGCAVARRLAELRPDDAIVLVEATRVGYGTSGRNAGFMLDHH